MTILTVFTAILTIVGGAFVIGWELLFTIDVDWFFEMSLGEIVLAVIGMNMFIFILFDILTGGGNIGTDMIRNGRRTKQTNRINKKKMNNRVSKDHYYAIKENNARNLKSWQGMTMEEKSKTNIKKHFGG